jgi:hypothetical protein
MSKVRFQTRIRQHWSTLNTYRIHRTDRWMENAKHFLSTPPRPQEVSEVSLPTPCLHNSNTRLPIPMKTGEKDCVWEESICQCFVKKKKGKKYGCRKLRIPVQSFVNPPGYIQVKRRRASNRFTAFVEYKANGQSPSVKGHGGVRRFGTQRRPEPVTEMEFLSWKEIRDALMLSLPTPPPQRDPFPTPSPFPQKYILAVWIVWGGKWKYMTGRLFETERIKSVADQP